MIGIRKDPSPDASNPMFKNKHVIMPIYHPAIFDGLAGTLRSCRAHQETTFSIQEDGRRFPLRSHALFSEQQNYDSVYKVEADGRHYCLTLVLSKPLFAALLKCLPSPDSSKPHSIATPHVMYLPIAYD